MDDIISTGSPATTNDSMIGQMCRRTSNECEETNVEIASSKENWSGGGKLVLFNKCTFFCDILLCTVGFF